MGERTDYILRQENDLLLLLFEKLYALRRSLILETSESVRFQLKAQIEELHRERERIELSIQTIENAYTTEHKSLIQEMERFLAN